MKWLDGMPMLKWPTYTLIVTTAAVGIAGLSAVMTAVLWQVGRAVSIALGWQV
jgi:hypothetical protein